MRVRAPLIPEVAFVEFPPMKSASRVSGSNDGEKIEQGGLTVLVEQDDISASEVNGVSSAQARHCSKG